MPNLKRSRSQDSAGYRSDQELVPRTLLHTLEILVSIRQFCQNARPRLLHEEGEILTTFWDSIDLSVSVLEVQKPLIDRSRKQAQLLTNILEIWEQVFNSSISDWSSSEAHSGDLAFLPKINALRRFLKRNHDEPLPEPGKLTEAFRVFDKDTRLMLHKQLRDWFRLLEETVHDVNNDYEISSVPKRRLRENSRNAWRVIKDIFQALHQLKCPDQDTHEIYLLLATYHEHERPVDNAYAYVDVLISVEAPEIQWREVRIHTFKLRFKDFEPALEKDPDWFSNHPGKVQSLCDAFSGSANNFRRNWVREKGLKLHDHISRPLHNPPSSSHSVISFNDFIDGFATTLASSKFLVWRISISAKMNLAVLLSHTLLHLCVIDRLRQEWPAQHIFFLRHNETTFLRPLLRMSTDLRHFETPAANDEHHQFPMLIGFATMLLELHECQTLRSMLPEASSSSSIRKDTKRLQNAFDSRLDNIGNQSLRKVIQFCLNPSFDEDESGNINDLQAQVYELIVKPLELFLESIDGANSPLDHIDDKTSRMNIETGIDISKHSGSTRKLDARAASIAHLESREERFVPPSLSFKGQPLDSIAFEKDNQPASSLNVLDLSPSTEPNPSQIETDNWFDALDSVLEFYLAHHATSAALNPIEVSILDTGIDRTHASVLGYKSRVRRVCSFVDGRDGLDEDDTSGDNCGHGTHIATSVLKWAPFAHVSIARVTDTKDASELSKEDSLNVARALRAARERWAADIIIMPFGFDRFQKEMDDELEKILRHERNILVFAAASNDGPDSYCAYPAWKSGIFCIRSTNGLGTWSKWNSSAGAEEYLFAIIGEDIESAWPGFSTSSVTCRERRSGTSYAAAMAGALAASVLHWSMSRTWFDKTSIKIKSFDGMKRVFKLMASKRVVTLMTKEHKECQKEYFSIFPRRLFRGDQKVIDGKIIDELTPQKT